MDLFTHTSTLILAHTLRVKHLDMYNVLVLIGKLKILFQIICTWKLLIHTRNEMRNEMWKNMGNLYLRTIYISAKNIDNDATYHHYLIDMNTFTVGLLERWISLLWSWVNLTLKNLDFGLKKASQYLPCSTGTHNPNTGYIWLCYWSTHKCLFMLKAAIMWELCLQWDIKLFFPRGHVYFKWHNFTDAKINRYIPHQLKKQYLKHVVYQTSMG